MLSKLRWNLDSVGENKGEPVPIRSESEREMEGADVPTNADRENLKERKKILSLGVCFNSFEKSPMMTGWNFPKISPLTSLYIQV
ncbi:hypothetical protein [Bacillus sp. Marseille-Q3570]|uniref:hypothetical protein n=1 Tax=Bacillus sp. Marseille-Q3570 TaxID=2963522 RepID=UPI0021B75BAA|nr:hypothetical protein [Bacillus sp. Marseille-Q3570]